MNLIWLTHFKLECNRGGAERRRTKIKQGKESSALATYPLWADNSRIFTICLKLFIITDNFSIGQITLSIFDSANVEWEKLNVNTICNYLPYIFASTVRGDLQFFKTDKIKRFELHLQFIIFYRLVYRINSI